MKHISVNLCGRDGYQCKPVPVERLKEAFSSFDVDTQDPLVTGSIELNNYGNVPEKLKGFVMTLDPILDFRTENGPRAEVAEISCRTELNPFSEEVAAAINDDTKTTGFLDLYSVYEEDPNIVTSVDAGETWKSMSVSLPLPAYLNHVQSIEVEPGILEPMLDTAFDNINIDSPTVNDLLIDGIEYVLGMLSDWRAQIENRFGDIVRGNITINAVAEDPYTKDMFGKQNTAGPCDNFKIYVKNNRDYISDLINSSSSLSEIASNHRPIYSVEDGTITFRNIQVEIPGYPYDVDLFPIVQDDNPDYLGLRFELCICSYIDADNDLLYKGYISCTDRESIKFSDSEETGGHITNTPIRTYPLGRVVPIMGNAYSGKKLLLWEIQQEDCIGDLELDDYKGPYAVHQYSAKASGAADAVEETMVHVWKGDVYIDGEHYSSNTSTDPDTEEVTYNTSFPTTVFSRTGMQSYETEQEVVLEIGYTKGIRNILCWRLLCGNEEVAKSADYDAVGSSVTTTVKKSLAILQPFYCQTQVQVGDIYIEHVVEASEPVSAEYDGPFAVSYVKADVEYTHTVIRDGVETEVTDTIPATTGKIAVDPEDLKEGETATENSAKYEHISFHINPGWIRIGDQDYYVDIPYWTGENLVLLDSTKPWYLYLVVSRSGDGYNFDINTGGATGICEWHIILAKMIGSSIARQEQYGNAEAAGRWIPVTAGVIQPSTP